MKERVMVSNTDYFTHYLLLLSSDLLLICILWHLIKELLKTGGHVFAAKWKWKISSIKGSLAVFLLILLQYFLFLGRFLTCDGESEECTNVR